MTDGNRDPRERAEDYVVGLLDDADRDAFESDLAGSAELRDALAEARDRFLELDMTADARQVPDGMWERIASRLDGQPTAPVSLASHRAKRSVDPWRPTALASLAASLLLAVALGWTLLTGGEPQVVAVLLNSDGDPVVLIEDFGGAEARFVPLVDVNVPQGRTMQVWTKWSEEVGPVSLGTVEASATADLGAPVAPAPVEQQLYEITFEPEGGSPTGLPTGEVYAIGYGKAPRQ